MSSNRNEKTQAHKPSESIMAASVAGLVETVLFHPADTVAKRLQKRVGPIRTTGEAFLPAFTKAILGNAADKPFLQKWSSLYPGLKWAMFYKVTQRGYKFGCQPWLQEFLQNNYGDEFKQAFGTNAKTMMHAVSGGLLGAGEVMFLPLDAMKIKYQTNKASYQGLNILEIARAENLYKGISFTITRNVIGSSTLFAVPYILKTSVLGLGQTDKVSNAQNAALSVVASTASIVISSPLDVVKTRIQSEKIKISGMKMGFTMFAEEGLLSFFKGAGMKVLMQGPKLAFAMFLTNKIVEALSDQRQQQENSAPRKHM